MLAVIRDELTLICDEVYSDVAILLRDLIYYQRDNPGL